MEPTEYGFKVTTHGRNILAACMGRETSLKLTRAAVGNGDVPEDVNLADVHELVHYIAEGRIGERRHEEDRLYLTIQYVNDAANAGVPTFILSEFMIYAINPVTGEEQDFIYAALNDYRVSIPAYRAGFAPGTWNFPVTTVISDEINVTVTTPAGLVLYDELIQLLNTRAAGAAQRDIIIPVSGWVENPGAKEECAYFLDIASMDITEDMVPSINVLPEHLCIAADFGLCQSSETLPCALRLYAKSVPTTPITASLTLLDTVPQRSGLSSSAATARLDIIIPDENWMAADPGESDCAFRTDIPDAEIDSCLVPMLTILPEHLALAAECGMSTNIKTIPGALRVYAKRKPTAPLHGSLVLLGVTQSITGNITGGGGGSFEMPIATETQLGVVRLGEGLIGTPDGTVSVKNNSAEDKDVEDMLGEVYPPNNN